MKKYFSIVILLSLFNLASHSQIRIFFLTPSGFRNSTDTGNDYFILEYKGKNKADLFKQVLLYINKTYVSPKDVISKVGEESITVNGFANNAIRKNNLQVYDMNYTINFEFKDEKIKISAPTFALTTFFDGKLRHLLTVSNTSGDGSYFGIWNEKLNLRHEMAKEDLEKYFNKYIAKFTVGLKANNDW